MEHIYSKSEWTKVVKRKFTFSCMECGASADLQAMYITPPSAGGLNTEANGLLYCYECRNRKTIEKNVVRFNFSIPESLHVEIIKHREKSGRTINDIIKQLIAECCYAKGNIPINSVYNGYNNKRISLFVLLSAFNEFKSICFRYGVPAGLAMQNLLERYILNFNKED